MGHEERPDGGERVRYPDYDQPGRTAFPEFFAPKPPLATAGFRFDPPEDLTYDLTPMIDKQLREIRERVNAIVEGEAIRAVVAHLRGLGYTVIEPTNPRPPAERRITEAGPPPHLPPELEEILGENGEILGTFDPNQQF